MVYLIKNINLIINIKLKRFYIVVHNKTVEYYQNIKYIIIIKLIYIKSFFCFNWFNEK